MKMTTIAKTSLALSILTTGAITVTTQSVKAEKTQVNNVKQTPTLKAEQSSMIDVTGMQWNNMYKGQMVKKAKATQVSKKKASEAKSEVLQSPTPPITPPTKTSIPQSTTTEKEDKYNDLRTYYTKPSLELKNQFGYMLKPWTTVRFMNIFTDTFIYKIALVGKDDQKYKDGPYDNIDVFIVLEDNKYQLKKYSVGGITKTNSKEINHKVDLSITKKDDKGITSKVESEYMIHKEEISLKELDFKLRKQLIEKHNLYSNIGAGTIVIKMKNGGKYTFELHKKLQEHRMADVIDGTSIDKIEVNIK
ncbi:TPA: superantigen-like protein [Staphylococcus aureus]|nr:superantigen-like protein [Staphylococcus aureus]HDK4489721.1 superantigen-like protein [Staphylococcus aureus]